MKPRGTAYWASTRGNGRGWAATAARKPRHGARAIALRAQRLRSWTALSREPLRLSEPCVPGKRRHLRSADEQCSKWRGDCSRRRLPAAARSGSLAALAGGETPSSCRIWWWWWWLLFLTEAKGMEPLWCAGMLTVPFRPAGMCVRCGGALALCGPGLD